MTGRERHRPPVASLPGPPAEELSTGDRAEHTHPVPRPVAWTIGALVVATLTGLLLLSAYAYSITARLSQVEAYIADRGQVRDAQAADIRAELRTAVCDVLDRLPPDAPALNPLRAEYGCGPGTLPEETP